MLLCYVHRKVLGILHYQTQQNLRMVLHSQGFQRENAYRQDAVGGHGDIGLGTVGPLLLLLFLVRPGLLTGLRRRCISFSTVRRCRILQRDGFPILAYVADISPQLSGGSCSGLGAGLSAGGTNVGALALSFDHSVLPLILLSRATLV